MSFKIALAFLREPRFALYILFGPLFVGGILTFFQVVFTYSAIEREKNTASDFEERIEENREGKFVRNLLYKTEDPFDSLEVCRWSIEGTDKEGRLIEVAPDESCKWLDSFDVTLRTSDPENFDSSEYEKLFKGSVEQIHLCRFCQSGIIMHPELDEDDRYTETKSPLGAFVLRLAALENKDLQSVILDTYEQSDSLKDLRGDVILWTTDKDIKINTGKFPGDSVLILNTATFVVVCLWLALKSHRKVLDYFQRSGALLPLVASLGKSSFYRAVWVITLARLSMFLLPTLPVLLWISREAVFGEELESSMYMQPAYFTVWVFASICSLSFLTILGSISELKHRGPYVLVLFRYIPLLLCLVGSCIWLLGTLFVDGAFFDVLRYFCALTPVLGLGALILAPVMKVAIWVMILHALSSLLALYVVLKYNSEWFGSHLEEL